MNNQPLIDAKLEVIRTLNNERTQGNWQIGYHGTERTVDDANGVSIVLMDGGYMDQEDADAAFIAAAPEMITRLLAIVDALKAKEGADSDDENWQAPPLKTTQIQGVITHTYTRPELSEIEE